MIIAGVAGIGVRRSPGGRRRPPFRAPSRAPLRSPAGGRRAPARPAAGSPPASALAGQQQLHGGVFDHEGEAVGRIGGVERRVGGAGFDHRQRSPPPGRSNARGRPRPRRPAARPARSAGGPRHRRPPGQLAVVELAARPARSPVRRGSSATCSRKSSKRPRPSGAREPVVLSRRHSLLLAGVEQRQLRKPAGRARPRRPPAAAR